MSPERSDELEKNSDYNEPDRNINTPFNQFNRSIDQTSRSWVKFLSPIVSLTKPVVIEINKMLTARDPETREKLKAEKSSEEESKEKDMTAKAGNRNVRLANFLSLAGFFVALIVTGIYPFLNSPILDYNIITEKIDDDTERVKIDLYNLGLGSAENTIISMKSENSSFFDLREEPFLSNHVKRNNTVNGNGFIEIDSIAPRSYTIIYAKLNVSQINEPNITTYVRSDERVGSHDTVFTIVFYTGLIVIYAILFSYLILKKRLYKFNKIFVFLSLGLVLSYSLGFSMAYIYIYDSPFNN